jgi:death-on-curing protein
LKLGDVAFLEISDVEAAHAEGLAVGGGSAGVRDVGLLSSAVMAPRMGYYGSLAELAAVYAFGVARNHPFVDGNKRAALAAAVVFLEVNGHRLTLEREKWRVIMEGLASGAVTRHELAERFAEEMGGAVVVRRTAEPADATLLAVLIDGFEKNEVWGGFHHRDLPMPDERSAIAMFVARAREATAWMGPCVQEQREGPRRLARWPDLEIRQAGRGVMVRAREAHFSDWWHASGTWKDDPMGLLRAWVDEDQTPRPV